MRLRLLKTLRRSRGDSIPIPDLYRNFKKGIYFMTLQFSGSSVIFRQTFDVTSACPWFGNLIITCSVEQIIAFIT